MNAVRLRSAGAFSLHRSRILRVPFWLPDRWLSTILRGTPISARVFVREGVRLSSARAAYSIAFPTRHVLVRVDDGLYTPLHLPELDVMKLDRGELLKAIRRDELFAEHMKGMPLDSCNVTVTVAVSDDEPPSGAAAVPLRGVRQLASVLSSSPGNVFVHVTRPQAALSSGSAELTALRSAIATAQQVDSLITLVEGAEWPQLGAVPLFVRSFYDGCYTGPLQSLTADRQAAFRKFIILGNPGIGKSAFGCYLLYRAIREGRTVVYQSAKLGKALVFHSQGNAEEVSGSIYENDMVWQLLKDHSTVFISDSITPKCVHAFTVLITSPNRERWSEFLKERDCARLVFPVFSWDEMLQLQRGCFGDLPGGEEGVAARFARWGGIPRYVLAKLEPDDQSQLEGALTKPDYAQLAQFLGKGELESEAAASHRLLHLKVKGEFDQSLSPTDKAFYTLARSELGSSYIADKVCQAMLASADNQLRSLLSLSPRPPSVAKLYGEVFERFALKTLRQHRGPFRMRRLQQDGKGTESELVFERTSLPELGFRTVQELKDLAAVTAHADRWFRPTSKSFCAVDFIMQGKRPANATVNLSHGLILRSKGDGSSGLLPVADALGRATPLEFHWVVPQADFDDWKRPQPLLVGDKVVREDGGLQVTQYVVGIHFDAKSIA